MRELPTPTFDLSPLQTPRGLLHPSGADIGLVEQKPAHGQLLVSWARHLDEVRQAQRLRHEIFCGEMGARIQTPIPGYDIDLFDDPA